MNPYKEKGLPIYLEKLFFLSYYSISEKVTKVEVGGRMRERDEGFLSLTGDRKVL